VLVLASGDVRFAGKSLPAEALEGSLRAAAAGESGPVRVVVRADGKADFGKVREVMKACAAAGLPDVLFAAHES
jgi:biopolymer transport protein ExbD